MKNPREYNKPTVTKVQVQPDESVVRACKPFAIECSKLASTYGS